MEKFTFGAIPSEYDPRDYTVSTTVKTFPESFRLPDVEIYNQDKVGTDEVYGEAVDIPSATYTYEETDESIEGEIKEE